MTIWLLPRKLGFSNHLLYGKYRTKDRFFKKYILSLEPEFALIILSLKPFLKG